MADYDIKKFQYVRGPDNEYHEFPIDMPDDQVDAEMADRYKDYKPEATVPDVPVQPVPQDDWRQKEAASALEAVSPTTVPAKAGIVGEQRGSLLPISRSYVTDTEGKKVFNGDYSFALPGFLYDLPEQINEVASHSPGSEYSDEDMGNIFSTAGFGLSPIGFGPDYGRRIFGTNPNRANMPTGGSGWTRPTKGPAVPRNYMMDDLKSTIKTRQALEDTPKAKIFREEALKTLDSPTGYGGVLRQSEREKGTQIVQRGAGAIRKSIEKAANKKPAGFGVDPVSLLAPSMLSTVSPGAAKAVAAARIAAGVVSKAKSGAAKVINNQLLKKDIRDFGKVLDLGKKGRILTSSKAKVEATRRDFENHPGSAPRTGRPPTNEELLNTGPSSAVPPMQPVSPISAGSGKPTVVDIGLPIKKTVGTDPRAAAARQTAIDNAPREGVYVRMHPEAREAVPPASTEGMSAVERLKAAWQRRNQPAPAVPEEAAIPPAPSLGATSPLPKAIDPEIQRAATDYIAEGGNVTRPLSKVDPNAISNTRAKALPTSATPKPSRLDILNKELERAKGDLIAADYAPNNNMRQSEIADANRRIKILNEAIEKTAAKPRLQDSYSTRNSKTISDKESALLAKPPQTGLSPKEIQAKKDAVAARAAEAAKPRVGPEGILAKQAEEVAADNAAKAAAEEVRRRETAARNAAAAKEPKTTAKAPRVKKAEPEPPPAQYEPATIKNAKGITLPTVKKVEAPPPPQAKGTPTTGRVKKQKGQSPTKVKKAETTQKEARAAKRANEEPYVADETDYRFGPPIVREGEIPSVDTFLRDFLERQRMNPDAAVSPLAEKLKGLLADKDALEVTATKPANIKKVRKKK